LGFQTGDTVDGFCGEFVADQVRRFATNGADLLGMGKIHISVQIGTGPDLANLQPSVRFIESGVLRGKKTPISNRRCLDARWSDYLSR
jgi:hypothetical protein